MSLTLTFTEALTDLSLSETPITITLAESVVTIGGGGGATNLAYTASATNGIVTSDTGADATLPLGTGTNAGLLSPAQFTKLSNLSGTNTGDQNLSGYLTSASAALTYEPLKGADDNFVTDAEKVKISNLSGTNTGDQTISDATISLTDITTNNVSTTKHGFAPKAPNDATKFLNGLGAWAVPSGGGGGASVISPSQITAWQNDYNPTSWASTVTVLRIYGDSSFRFITGLTATAAGHQITIENKGAYCIGLKHQSTSSTAANRFDIVEDKIIFPYQSIILVYDAVDSLWHFVSGCEELPHSIGNHYHQDFYGVVSNGEMTSANGGAGAAVAIYAAEASHPGVITISTGTTASGEAHQYSINPDSIAFAAGMYASFECMVKLLTLSTVGDEYRARFGFMNGNGVGIVNGAALFYNDPGYSANWTLITRDGAAQTLTGTGVAATTSWIKAKIIYYPDSHVEVWLNDVQVISNATANMPTSSGFSLQMFKLEGTNNRQMLVDYMTIKNINNTTR